jgi:hypothetical protein
LLFASEAENSRESDALSPFAINSKFGMKILLSTLDVVNRTPNNPDSEVAEIASLGWQH